MSGPKAQENQYAKQQAEVSQQWMNQITPFMSSLMGQGTELLKTGGMTSASPMLNTMIQAAKSAYSKGKQSTVDQMAKYRLAGTPFGQRILADQTMAGESAVANVAPNFYQWFLPIVANAAVGAGNTAMGGMSSATGAEASRINTQTQAQGQYQTALLQGMMRPIPTTSFNFGGGGGGGG